MSRKKMWVMHVACELGYRPGEVNSAERVRRFRATATPTETLLLAAEARSSPTWRHCRNERRLDGLKLCPRGGVMDAMLWSRTEPGCGLRAKFMKWRGEAGTGAGEYRLTRRADPRRAP
jgi:hypothetical protein